MKRVMIAVVSLSVVAGCDKPGGSGQGDEKAAASASAVSPPPPAVVFAGTYRAAWGDTVFTQAGSAVNAVYPGGTLSCKSSESALDCSWKEGGAGGKALLTRNASGAIEGTWGNGDSASDGGKWSFAPKK